MKTGNPYPGPRPLTRDDRIYGRTVELRRLTNLLVSERIVLLYSPSGAGKTSLLQAGLLPRLDRAGFRVLGPVRPGMGMGMLGGAPGNRYVAATVDALRDQLGVPLELPPGSTVADCFTALGPPPPKPFRLGAQLEEEVASGSEPAQGSLRPKLWQADVLVFDQFEEVLLADPGDHRQRMEFFEQLGEVLRDRNRWALFSMREEHVASLDPYRRPIPTQLRTTFRLDLLGIPEAIEAIRGPAERAGVSFPEDIAERLARNLAGVTETEHSTGTPDDGALPASRHWVEPVQLQVVCQRIWNKLGPDDGAITELTQIGTVDEALASYYADSAQDAARESGYRERRLRELIQDELITPSGTRNQFLWEKRPETATRDNAIERLDKSHLIRAESRRDVLWVELAHDRLVKPIQEDNAAWLDRTLQPFQKRAQAWQRSGQADLLLAGPALAEAEAWASGPGNRGELDDHPGEADFLKESRAAEEERLRKRRQRRQAIFAGAGLTLLAVGVLVFFLVQSYRASQQELSRRLGFDAVAVRNGEPSLALLLAANAFRAWNTFEARSSLIAALSPEGQPKAEYDAVLPAEGGPWVATAKGSGALLLGAGDTVANLAAVAVSPDGRRLASGSRAGVIYAWDIGSKEPPNVYPIQGAPSIERLAYSPDGGTLAAGDGDGRVWLFANRGAVLDPLGSFAAEPDTINGMVWGANGALYTLGKGDLAQWQVSESRATEVVRRLAPEARALAISPAHDFLAVAYEDGSAATWPLGEGAALPAGADPRLQGSASTPTAVAIATTGDIAAAYENGLVVRWPRDGGSFKPLRFTGSMDSLVTGLVWAPSGKWLAASGRDHQAVAWDVEKGGVLERWRGHSDAVQAITLDPSGELCFTAGQDGRVLEWPAPGNTAIGPFVRQFEGPKDELWTVAFSPAVGPSRQAATGTRDGEVRLWTFSDTGDPASEVIKSDLGSVRHVTFSDDGAWLAAGDELGQVLLWEIRNGAAVEPHATFHHGDGFINGLAFSGDALISAGQVDPGELDNYLKAWPLNAGQDQPLSVSQSVGLATAMETDSQGQIWMLNGEGHFITETWSPSSRIFRRESDVDLSSKDGSVPSSLAVLDGGELLAVGTTQGRLVLVRPPGRGAAVQRTSLDAHMQNLSAVAFSPAGDLLATAGWDGQVMLWDVESRRRLGEPLSSGGLGISDIAFSKDGRWLAVASDKRALMLYPATPEQWVQAACESAGRALTQDERDRYLDGKDSRACSR